MPLKVPFLNLDLVIIYLLTDKHNWSKLLVLGGMEIVKGVSPLGYFFPGKENIDLWLLKLGAVDSCICIPIHKSLLEINCLGKHDWVILTAPVWTAIFHLGEIITPWITHVSVQGRSTNTSNNAGNQPSMICRLIDSSDCTTSLVHVGVFSSRRVGGSVVIFSLFARKGFCGWIK